MPRQLRQSVNVAKLEKENAKLEKEREKIEKQLGSTQSKLSNADFKTKAPAELIATFEKNLDQMKRQLAEIEQKLKDV